MLRNIVSSFFYLLVLLCFAQQKEAVNVDVVPPAPNASALLEYANIPVNYYTGTPEIEVPIYTLKGRHLEVPVSLSYHASGIKVDDIPSWVGLGWTLNAGGVITRQVLGLPDEDEDGYCGVNQQGLKANTAVNKDYLDDIRYERLDSEPDLFFFNFMGRTGRFVINAQGDPIMLPYQSIKIEPAIGPNASEDYWVITDEKGIRYIFGETSNSREETSSQQHTAGPCNQPDSKNFISSWYLDRIEFRGEEISFNYAHTNAQDFTYKIEADLKIEYDFFGGDFTCYPSVYECYQDYSEITINSPKYLSSITSVLGTVTLNSSAGRSDFSSLRKLNSVQVKNYNNELIKKYDFNYGYFSPSCSSVDCKRLKLTSITDATSSNSYVHRSFEYYEDQNLPPRNSYKIDHWGYYNNNTINDLIPTVSGVYSGADRSPQLSKSRANSLKKIINPTGGIQELIYELHSYLDVSTLKNAGGLRIGQIKVYPSPGSTPMITKYNYLKENSTSSGLIFKKPKYDHDFSYNLEIYTYDNNNPNSSSTNTCGSSGTTIYSHSLAERFDLTGNHIGYSRVVIELPTGGEQIINYTNYVIDDNRYDDVYDPSDYFSGIYNGPIDPYGPPFAFPSETKFWARGFILEETLKDDTNSTLKENIYDYEEFDYTGVSDAKGVKSGIYDFTTYVTANTSGASSSNSVGKFMTGIYTYKSKGLRLNYSEHYAYDQFGDESTSSRVDYTYSSIEPNFVKTETTTHPDGSRDKVEYAYPFDLNAPGSVWYTYALALKRMNYIHDIADPVESVHYYARPSSGFNVVGAQLNRYKMVYGTAQNNGDLGETGEAFLETVLSLEIDAPLSSSAFTKARILEVEPNRYDLDFDDDYSLDPQTSIGYDDFGNISSVSSRDGIDRQYSWGYNNALVIESIENPGAEQHRTSYSHIPLVGLSSLTDPNNRITDYEYDERNRLHLIRDNENNIVERYRYNYQGESNDLSAEIKRSGLALAGNTVQFSLSNIMGYGEPESHWSILQDGTTEIANGSGPTIDLPITSADVDYTIKLALVSPEYDAPFNTEMEISSYECSDAFGSAPGIGLNGAFVGGTATINMAIQDENLTISSVTESASWVTSVSVASDGKSFTFNFSSNPSTASRAVTFNVGLSGCSTQQVSFNQSGQPDGPGECLLGCYWDSTSSSCICN